MLKYLNPFLHGFSQIMLQENPLTGLFFIVGIFFGSTFMGMAAITAVLTGTLTAIFLSYPRDEVKQGLYGFSPALVGVALALFFQPIRIVWLAIIAGSIAAAILQRAFIKKKIPGYTFPFVLVTWLLIFFLRAVYPETAATATAQIPNPFGDFTFAFSGYGQVIFQSNALVGFLFFLGVFFSSPVAALSGIIASLIAGIASLYVGVPLSEISLGLFSYNAVLCAIVFQSDKLKETFWVFLSVLFSIAIVLLMHKYSLLQLTFPFVAAAWLTLLSRGTVKKMASNRVHE